MKRKKRKTSGMFDGADAGMIAAAALAGIVVGIVDFASEEIFPAGALILVFTFLLGLKLPRLAWLWAMLIGGAVPLVWYVAMKAGYWPADLFGADALTSTVSIGPAIVGAYMGALTRHIGDHVQERVRG